MPDGLELDVFDGKAWVGMTPFRVSRMRPTLLPALPAISAADEINLRIYMQRDGIPGVWFPSLDITNRVALWGARLAYRLPFPRPDARRRPGRSCGLPQRAHGDAARRPRAAVAARAARAPPAPDSLEFFLVERYVLTADGPRVCCARIHHRPWPLAAATVLRLRSTLLEAAGMPTPGERPLARAQAEPFDVDIWLPAPV